MDSAVFEMSLCVCSYWKRHELHSSVFYLLQYWLPGSDVPFYPLEGGALTSSWKVGSDCFDFPWGFDGNESEQQAILLNKLELG